MRPPDAGGSSLPSHERDRERATGDDGGRPSAYARHRPAGRFAAPSDDASRREAWQEMDRSSVMVVELLVAIGFLGGLGWLADEWLGAAPWFLAIGVLTGFACGLYLIYLRSLQPAGSTGWGGGSEPGDASAAVAGTPAAPTVSEEGLTA